MRVPKDSQAMLLSRKADTAIERVFRLLREHQEQLEPPELRDAYDKYRTATRAEAEHEWSEKERK